MFKKYYVYILFFRQDRLQEVIRTKYRGELLVVRFVVLTFNSLHAG